MVSSSHLRRESLLPSSEKIQRMGSHKMLESAVRMVKLCARLLATPGGTQPVVCQELQFKGQSLSKLSLLCSHTMTCYDGPASVTVVVRVRKG